MEKCDIAQTGSGKFIHAEDARRFPRARWYCADCSCPLILRTVSAHRKAWFEHDPKALASMKLRPCRFIQPVKTEPVTRAEEIALSKHRNGFRMMKCFLAHDHRHKLWRANQQTQSFPDKLYCTSCSCVLIWHPATASARAWFEHDQLSVPSGKLKSCPHLDPAVREEERIGKLKYTVRYLDAMESITEWYCVYCSTSYSGSKFCANCKDGIYSIKATNVQDPVSVPHCSTSFTSASSAIASDKNTDH